MADTVLAAVALGSNLGDPRAQVEHGFAELAKLPKTRVRARSPLYRTKPWGVAEQPDFINAAALLDTGLAPQALLAALLGVETRAGRVRSVRYGPRTLDLDLLLYGGQVLATPQLRVPHPRLHERAFVLAPLADIAPGLVVPGRGRVAELLARVDASGCTRLA